MSSRWKRFRSASFGLSLVAMAGSTAHADTIDPSMPRAIVVGAPRGFAPSERLDARRSGRAGARLPFPLVEVWRRHVSSGLDHPPLVDGEGNLLLALNLQEVVKLSPDAREIWRVRTGAAAAAAAPALLSDGTLAVVTSAGLLWGITPSGTVRFTTPLGVRGRDVDAAPLALPDGGIVVAGGSTLVAVDRDGAVRARAAIEDRAPGAVLPTPERAFGAIVAGPEGAVVVTTEVGGVYTWRPPGAPRKVGSLGGIPRRGAALADGRTLVAVVDNRRLVALDLATGALHVRGSAPPGTLIDGPVALASSAGPSGARLDLAVLATESGILVGIDPAGNERIRVTLEKPPPPPPGALGSLGAIGAVTVAPLEPKPSPPVVIDPLGRIAFARTNGRVGVASPEGRIELAGERVCSAPVAVVPTGDKRLLLACRDGGLFMYGE